MLPLPQTAEYALRAVCYIAEHGTEGPVPVSALAEALGAPQNYLSKTLHLLGSLGVLRSVRGTRGGYLLGGPPEQLPLIRIVEPFLPPTERRCIMGRSRCSDTQPCGAHWRWKHVNDTARAFFMDLTLANLLGDKPQMGDLPQVPSAAGDAGPAPLPSR
ncbi:MAG TPA: Rrf2 family transcriptional regulator [Gemmatimonadales bacterium]